MMTGTKREINSAKRSIKNSSVKDALMGADSFFLPILILARTFITGEPRSETTQASKIQMRISLK
jgi:hypothetical protein